MKSRDTAPRPGSGPHYLPAQPQRHLDMPLQIDNACTGAKISCRRGSNVRVVESGVVESVEELGSELQLHAFVDREILYDRSVHIIPGVASKITETLRERAHVPRKLLGRVAVELRNVEDVIDVARIPVQWAAIINRVAPVAGDASGKPGL